MVQTKVAIFGLGVVGGALYEFFKSQSQVSPHYRESFQFLRYDKDASRGWDDVSECSVAFICVPAMNTPTGQDLTNIEECISLCPPYCQIFVRSTVLPGTCDDLSKRFNRTVYALPEFLSERTAVQDMWWTPIISGTHQTAILKQLFIEKEVYGTDNKTAEFAKYIHNVNGAVLVLLSNLFFQTDPKRYDEATKLACITGHMDELYRKVPGPDGKLGFGGTCFPKDIYALATYGMRTQLGDFLEHVSELNKQIRERSIETRPQAQDHRQCEPSHSEVYSPV